MNEKARFYDSNGIARIEYADPKRKGEFRDPTIDDAKKSKGKLKPSVTTVLGALRMSFGLLYYIKDQNIEAAFRHLNELDEDIHFLTDEDKKKIMRDADEHSKKAAKQGTSVHAAAANFIESGEKSPEWATQIGSLEKILNGIDVFYNNVTCEKYLIGQEFAGTPDIVAETDEATILIDLKTQEIDPDNPRKKDFKFYPEWSYQLAAYQELVGARCRCISIVLDRNPTGYHDWKEWTPKEMIEAHDVFRSALTVWKIQNQYWPEKALQESAKV